MEKEKRILCGASSYEELFYFNPDFDRLPGAVKDELRIMCVLYTTDVGGILRLEFDEDGKLNLVALSREDDFFFDEIGSVLKIKQIQREKQDLFAGLETYYKLFFLQKGMEDNHVNSY